MDWLVLVDGAPDATNDPWNEPEAIPDPLNFFRVLCWEIGGIELGPITILDRQIEPREDELVSGFQGTDQIGVRIVEHRSLFSSMFPVEAWQETYGLSGMQVTWEYNWAYAGQAGHSIFEHRLLRAWFATPAAQAQFERIWHTAFGKFPVFQPAPPGDPT